MAEAIIYGDGYPERWHYYLNDTEIEPPLDWADVQFEWARDKDTDGIVMMPSVPVRFAGNGAKMIRAWVYERRTAEPLTLSIKHLNPDMSYTTYYTGGLSAETFQDHLESVEIQTEESGLESRIRSNAKVVYDIPTPTDAGVYFKRPAYNLKYEAVNMDGRVKVEVKDSVTTIASDGSASAVYLPLGIVYEGDPFFYQPAAPDAMLIKRAGVIRIMLDCSGAWPSLSKATVVGDPNNKGTITGTVEPYGDRPYTIRLAVYNKAGAAKLTHYITPGQVGGVADSPLSVEVDDLVVCEVCYFKATIRRTGGSPQEPDTAYIDFGTRDNGLPFAKITSEQHHQGVPALINALSAFTVLREVARKCSGNPSLDILQEYAPGVALNTHHMLFTTADIVGRPGTIRASFEGVRKYYHMLGFGLVFEFADGKERLRITEAYRTGARSSLWPLSGANIATPGADFASASVKTDEAALFSAVRIGFAGGDDYKVLPYYKDPCGVATYTNTNDKSDTVLDLTCPWRADAMGVEDILLQRETGGDPGGDDTIWVLDCYPAYANSGGPAFYYPPSYQGAGLTWPGVDTNTAPNMRLRPSVLLADIQPRLAVPVALLADKTYTFAGSQYNSGLLVKGQPDTQPLTVSDYPTYLPLSLECSTALRDNLYAAMQDVNKRYGYFTFEIDGATVWGYIHTMKLNPTEEHTQRLKLRLAPDTDITKLIH